MFVILIYDITIENHNHSKVLNTCRQYLFHIQDSCFHGYISYKNYNQLVKKLNKMIKVDDHIVIYKLSSDKYLKIDEVGVEKIQHETIIK